MKLFALALTLAAVSVAPAAAADPLASLRFLAGTWNCTYQAGKTHVYYKATFSYDLNDNWLRESDSWTGGGSDLGLITYDPKGRGWTSVVIDHERTTVVFRANGSDPNHVVYHSVYPKTTFTDVFDRVSPTRYTLHFTDRTGSRTVHSTDVCVKT